MGGDSQNPQPGDPGADLGPWLRTMADELVTVPGVVAVVLGGSRARGEHSPDSDVDLGLYYRGAIDVAALQELADRWSDEPVTMTPHGGWGPWVDGGGWLTVATEGAADVPGRRLAVDWIYRDLDRVRRLWDAAQRGEFAFHEQPGHPLGFLDVSYVGELALARVLADPSGEVTALRDALHMPPALARTITGAAWQAGFLVDGAAKGAKRGDAVYVALCAGKAVLLVAHALHARAGRWVLNEKGAVPACDGLPGAPRDFSRRCSRILGTLGTSPDDLGGSLASLRAVLDEADLTVTDPS